MKCTIKHDSCAIALNRVLIKRAHINAYKEAKAWAQLMTRLRTNQSPSRGQATPALLSPIAGWLAFEASSPRLRCIGPCGMRPLRVTIHSVDFEVGLQPSCLRHNQSCRQSVLQFTWRNCNSSVNTKACGRRTHCRSNIHIRTIR